MRKSPTCIDCRVVFTYEHTGGPTRQRCDTCRALRKAERDKAKTKAYRERDPERAREQSRRHHLKRKDRPEWRAYKNQAEMVQKYGITMVKFNELLENQGGVCAICASPHRGSGKRFHVDHCHDTNKVRGLLCGNCNTAIGLLGDDPERAEKAAAYLRR